MLSDRRRARGFSGVELLATVAVLLVLGSAYTVWQVRTNIVATEDDGVRNVTRAVVDVMTRELRMATYDPENAIPVSPGPCAPGVKQGITEATPTKIRFRQDLNRDGVIAASGGEDVTYDLVGDAIRRGDGVSAPVVLASGIATNGLGFRYFDGARPPVELVPAGSPPALTACQRDRVVRIRIDVLAHRTNPDIASLAESEVAIRNRSRPNF